MISVVVPAHQEETVIGGLLTALTSTMRPGEIEVIVVCNGCTDGTATVARSFGPPVVVLEIDEASKVRALNEGDRAASSFPRFYVDADVVVTGSAIGEVALALESGVFAAAPRPVIDLTNSSRWVRAFYDIWTRLPYLGESLIGSGVYGLSAEGRARFPEFPDLISDDGYIRLLFSADERRCIQSCSFTIFAPAGLRELVAIKTRSRLGTLQLRHRYPASSLNEPPGYARATLRLAREPSLWWSLIAYAFVVIVTRAIAAIRFHRGDLTQWDRDEGSRRRRPK